MSGWGKVMIETCILYFLGVGGAVGCVFLFPVWIGKYEHTVLHISWGLGLRECVN